MLPIYWPCKFQGIAEMRCSQCHKMFHRDSLIPITVLTLFQIFINKRLIKKQKKPFFDILYSIDYTAPLKSIPG